MSFMKFAILQKVVEVVYVYLYFIKLMELLNF
jgi:hypothetical protein